VNSQQVVDIGSAALVVSAKVAGPFLIVVLAIGVIVGLFQSVTQLQEPTLSFVPKLLGAAIVIAVAGNWMLMEMVTFGRELIGTIPQYLEG
jgi:flagellar biosynthesis protein FliQ